MKRIQIEERTNRKDRLLEVGFGYDSAHWKEDRYYRFTSAEIDQVEEATESLYNLLHTAIDQSVKDDEVMSRMGIPYAYQRYIRESWERSDPSVCLRFDLARNKNGEIKLIEVNGDTPTSLIETSLVQWYWLVDKFPEVANREVPGQFNSLHEKLLEAWSNVASRIPDDDWMAFSAHTGSLEEFATCEYHRDLATQAGVRTGFVDLNPDSSQFMYSPTENVFHEPGGHKINYWYKLYPWEWMWNEEFGVQLAQLGAEMGIIEPVWKAVAANKAILSQMYKLDPSNPYLVPTFDQKDAALGESFFVKPIWGRESTGIKFINNGEVLQTESHTPDPVSSKVAPVYQKNIDVHQEDGWYTQFGSWVANHKPAGMGVRESQTPIISGESSIVPHLYEE